MLIKIINQIRIRNTQKKGRGKVKKEKERRKFCLFVLFTKSNKVIKKKQKEKKV
jgi:hypothetical protein